MNINRKTLLAASLLALPLPFAQAAGIDGEGADGSLPVAEAANPAPPETMPAPTIKSTGEGVNSSMPGTDQPLTTTQLVNPEEPAVTVRRRATTQAGSPQPIVPSMESPPFGAPMSTGEVS